MIDINNNEIIANNFLFSKNVKSPNIDVPPLLNR